MQIKVFRAANLQAALEEIRDELGPNASVLKTRQCRDGWMGWLGRSYVEVTATPDELADDELPPILPFDGSYRFAGKPIDSRRAVPNVSSIYPTSDPLADCRMGLITLGVAPDIADRWIRSTNGFLADLEDKHAYIDPAGRPYLEQLRRSVAREIRLSGPIRLTPGGRRIVALIGPTGVGKTTTVAKLAAGYRVESNRRVGLVTIDTFRIAAVQQLQAYAQIMDLPMSVVESADQMRGAIERLGDVDLILIDTAGRSPKGDLNIANLSELLGTAQPDETHLVISATSTAAVVESAIKGFSAAQPTSAILTKLDETPYTAGVLSAIAPSNGFAGIPISYVTNGQHVPDDIAVATADRLLARLVPAPVGLPQFGAA